MEIIKSVNVISNDLVPIVVEYELEVRYHEEPTQIWKLDILSPQGLTSDQQLLYICDYSQQSLRVLNFKGQIIKNNFPRLSHPSDIDFYENCFYVMEGKKVSIFDLQFQLLSSFPLPDIGYTSWHRLKVDQSVIYITIRSHHQIYVYTREGKLQQTIGPNSASSKQGEFNEPCGLTVDSKTLYICDSQNHRVQALNKTNYSFYKQWGKEGRDNGRFESPYSIYYCENTLYVGDSYSVQLFNCEGIFLQRILGKAEHLVVVTDRLYVRDWNQIQVYKRMTSYEIEEEKEKQN